jgi:uncharacterized iron-regulated protein
VTIGVYFDDLIITSPSAQLVGATNKAIKDKYIQLNLQKGHTHNYLGMVLDFAEAGHVYDRRDRPDNYPGTAAIEQAVGYNVISLP